ncbi:MAG: 4-(cytidine 5'-diphospho)-2-C-methyl-D-erythritol kinase [Betaproteobacteria bacterium]|nr:4-(cytidine 5'-diphospho)-2-C-methyl-D-erythritol kinase [Betaproteobacteria bacterium]
MNPTTYLAPAKLNLFLHVVGRRADGYHLLQSAFCLLNFGDTLEIQPRADNLIQRLSALPGVEAENDLVIRAARLLQQQAGERRGCDIHVSKRIPMGGGLGGGSSDAATTLLALNQLWGLNWPNERLQALGLQLGADVPFFVRGQSAIAEGIGERLTPIDIPSWWYLVLTPPINVPTIAVFSAKELTRDTNPLKITDFSAGRLCDTLRGTRNDLQAVVVKAFPVVAAHLEALITVGQKALFGARMTGSGSSVFAAFETEADARLAFKQLAPEYPGFIAQGIATHPLQQ